MTRPFRVIDTGARSARANIAFDAALIEARRDGRIPDTIRFLEFPKSALLGRHQAASQEIRTDYCKANGIEIARRITGGGAIYFDEGQLGWELVFSRRTLGIESLGDVTRAICEAVAMGLRNLGVAANFRPRNDIEVDGRKICGTGGFFDGDTIFYQGTLLIDSDPETMVKALKVPEEKLAKRGLSEAAQRMTTLKALQGDKLLPRDAIKQALLRGLADGLGIEAVPGATTADEEHMAKHHHNAEIGTDEFVYEIDDPAAGDGVLAGTHTGPGGTVRAYLRLEGVGEKRVREALITGDFFVTPPRTVMDLESALRGVPVDDIAPTVEKFFAAAPVGLLTIKPADFAAALSAAIRA